MSLVELNVRWSRIGQLQRELNQEIIDYGKAKAKFKVGDEVDWKGRKYIVHSVDVSVTDHQWSQEIDINISYCLKATVTRDFKRSVPENELELFED